MRPLNLTSTPCVVVAGAHTLVMFSVAWAVKKAFGIIPSAQATTAEDTLEQCRNFSPDILILDCDINGEDISSLIRKITKANPSIRILITSGNSIQNQVYKVIKEGVHGYFYIGGKPTELVTALNDIKQGRRHFCPVAIEALSGHIKRASKESLNIELTNRELLILEHLALGKTVKEIAGILRISGKTVYAHRTSILNKTQCKDNVGLAHYAIQQGVIST